MFKRLYPVSKGELTFFTIALVLFLFDVLMAVETYGAKKMSIQDYPVFIPMGLLVLSFSNRLLGSKSLGWGIFTISFVCFMVVLGAFVVHIRMLSETQGIIFFKSLMMYACLGIAGLYQIKSFRRPILNGHSEEKGV